MINKVSVDIGVIMEQLNAHNNKAISPKQPERFHKIRLNESTRMELLNGNKEAF